MRPLNGNSEAMNFRALAEKQTTSDKKGNFMMNRLWTFRGTICTLTTPHGTFIGENDDDNGVVKDNEHLC